MELIEAIYQRRSIRKYENRPVSQEVIDLMLGAAMMAPSAGDARPWRFIVLTGEDQVSPLARILPHAQMTLNAPLAIVVCADKSVEKFPGCWMLDASCATQNLLLTAHSVGLGAVWIALWPFNEFVQAARGHFGLPEEVEPLALIVAGYPAESVPSEDRFDPSMVHKGSW